jgi:hypothetical protein
MSERTNISADEALILITCACTGLAPIADMAA